MKPGSKVQGLGSHFICMLIMIKLVSLIIAMMMITRNDFLHVLNEHYHFLPLPVNLKDNEKTDLVQGTGLRSYVPVSHA